MQTSTDYYFKTFYGGKVKQTLIRHKAKQWFHMCYRKEWFNGTSHPGMPCTEQTLWQHFWWITHEEDVQKLCSTDYLCQWTKITHEKDGHFPKEFEPWKRLCIDMVGPNTVKIKGMKLYIMVCNHY
jgi:hypothetical protein